MAKRLKKIAEQCDSMREYSAKEALEMLKKFSSVKFDETVEVAVNLGIDPRHADQQVRGAVSLPKGTGKSVRVAVFARADKADEAKKAGADIVGAEDLMEKVQRGEIDFDRCIATPDMMAIVGRIGKILGPKGLMPNPKLGTVTPNPAKAVEEAKAGQVQFRAEKAGIIHGLIGKVSFDASALEANLNAFIQALLDAKPSGAKGKYVRRITVSTTMGPGIKIDSTPLMG